MTVTTLRHDDPVIEHTFSSGTGDPGIDYPGLVDGFRCRTTAWIRAERDRVVRDQRALRVRELALTRVLDERGQIDDSLAQADGVSVRAVRETVATARALEDLPTIAAVAAAGRLSAEQLTQVVKVAEPSDEHRWADEAPSWSPQDLAQEARTRHTPTVEEAAARRDARELRWWWNRRTGMLDGRFSLPDLDGARFENLLTAMTDQMRPARGEAWETRARRGADALMVLVDAQAAPASTRGHEPTPAPPVHLVVEVPLRGPATVAGVPLPDAMVEQLRAHAVVEPVLVDDAGAPVAVGRCESALSEKTKRVVRRRDGRCRWPGCDRRTGLEVHHLWPRSWGGDDRIANLASVCTTHHHRLVPQGPRLLLGDPNHPAGLVLVDHDDPPALAQLAAERARADDG
jgi:hypothetical protein